MKKIRKSDRFANVVNNNERLQPNTESSLNFLSGDFNKFFFLMRGFDLANC